MRLHPGINHQIALRPTPTYNATHVKFTFKPVPVDPSIFQQIPRVPASSKEVYF
ncbi:hypothetical protein M408DRAFT_326642 [Serendipita vermifera MAFF 305830]|uniref:Uncharacterized protein n=1 Tax=Serendipita vermifera MAFF 305830 TaxID=933852 RepID=A0A0C3BLL6_SERVB|nr:hypothetical protein M408DRAFT_326642 [Serendipita vermifera MAFF 305830]